MKRVIFLVALFLSLRLLAQAQAGDLSTSVKVINAPGLPVQITQGELRDFMHTSKLTYFLQNMTSEPLRSASLFLSIVRKGKVVEGEGWNETASRNHPADGALMHDSPLHLQPGDQAYLMITALGTKGTTYTLEGARVGQILLDVIAGNIDPAQIRFQSSSFEGAQPLEVPDCSAGLAQATLTCTNGVASFSCSTSGYSFTCK